MCMSHTTASQYILTDNMSGHEEDDNLFYSLPDDNDGETPSGENGKPSRNPLILLAKLICTPVEGWKEIKRSDCTIPAFAWRCFYPLALIAALSIFANLYYNPETSVAFTVTESVIVFMSLLLANFCTLLGGSLLLPGNVRKRLDTTFGRIFIMAMMSIIALTVTVTNLLPYVAPLLSFIPIYVVYLIVRGVKFLRIPDTAVSRTWLVLAILIIGLPFLFKVVFTGLIPQ